VLVERAGQRSVSMRAGGGAQVAAMDRVMAECEGMLANARQQERAADLPQWLRRDQHVRRVRRPPLPDRGALLRRRVPGDLPSVLCGATPAGLPPVHARQPLRRLRRVGLLPADGQDMQRRVVRPEAGPPAQGGGIGSRSAARTQQETLVQVAPGPKRLRLAPLWE